MELSIFLAQVIGAYLLLTSLAALVKRKTLMQAIKSMARNTHVVYIIAAVYITL